LAPSRELANQIYEEALTFCKFMNIRCYALVGGGGVQSIEQQVMDDHLYVAKYMSSNIYEDVSVCQKVCCGYIWICHDYKSIPQSYKNCLAAMCACIHTWCINMYACNMCACIDICIQTQNKHTYLYVKTRTHSHACVSKHTHTCICTHTHTNVRGIESPIPQDVA